MNRFYSTALFLLTLCAFVPLQATAQQSYTFTTAGATGSLGPTQSDISTTYVATNLDGSVTVNPQGIQNFTIPITGDYRIEARGAQGYGTFGGRGAVMIGDFNFTAGSVIKILVGQTAIINNSSYSNQYGGGGGSFVVDASNNPLVIAGGGGGSHLGSFHGNADGSTSAAGNDGTNGTSNGTGGTSGNGGTAGNNADGGGGLNGDGGGTYAGGTAFVNGGMGGGYRGIGGFGGGAGTGSYNDTRAGGGGGYSGGGGSHQSGSTGFPVGGGGGSFNGGSNQNNTAGQNIGDGMVIVTRLCDITLNASENPICLGDAVTLSTNAGSNITWSTGDAANSITVSPLTNTSYTVSGISSSTTACTSTLVITVTVHPLPQVSASGVPSVVCPGSTATLLATGANTYTWSNAATDFSTAVAPAGSAIYTVTGTDGNNCSSDATVQVEVSTSSLTVSPPFTLCPGTTGTVSATGAQAGTYMWDIGAAFATIPVSPTVNTLYQVTGTDIHNCMITGSVQVSVWPSPMAGLGPDRDLVCVGESVVLTAAGGDDYQFSTGESGSTNTVMVTPLADVTYTYSVLVTDENGCQAEATTSLMVEKCTGLESGGSDLISGIWPNPSNGNVTIAFKNSAIRNLVITDMQGRVLFDKTTSGTEIEIDLSGYARGLYYVSVNTEEGSATAKLIRN